LDVYYRPDPGARFADPDSFRQGTLAASYEGTFQSIVTVTAPRRGIETLTGALRQTAAHRIALPGGRRTVGRRGQRLKLSATGTGRLLDPKRPKAVLVLAGNAVVAD